MDRRQAIKLFGISPLIGSPVFNSKTLSGLFVGEHVIVVGGGMAGATAAKYLRLWGAENLKVTLIEANPTYYSNIFSNKIITDELTLAELSYDYTTLKCQYGVDIVRDSVEAIDPVLKSVELSSGAKMNYDKLILAPGIDFQDIPIVGTPSNMDKVVHAWQAGEQTINLKNQVASMSSTETFILSIPPVPFRCPPGPYERACVIADYLKRKNGSANVIILDSNNGIQAGVENFTFAFNNTHADAITYIPNATLQNVNADTGTVQTSQGTFHGDIINVIPPHRGAKLILNSGIGLANSADNNWAVVDVLDYQSTAVDDIHVIGDSSSTTQPKAGHVANAEAKICADAVIKQLSGIAINDAPMTNSACFTPITDKTASWLTVVYRYDPLSQTMKPTGNGVTESNAATEENYDQMNKWFENLMQDTFG